MLIPVALNQWTRGMEAAHTTGAHTEMISSKL